MYFAKMINGRVTDSISCVKTIRKHFSELKNSFQVKFEQYCVKMLFTLIRDQAGWIITLLYSERNRYLWKAVYLFCNLGIEMVLGQWW